MPGFISELKAKLTKPDGGVRHLIDKFQQAGNIVEEKDQLRIQTATIGRAFDHYQITLSEDAQKSADKIWEEVLSNTHSGGTLALENRQKLQDFLNLICLESMKELLNENGELKQELKDIFKGEPINFDFDNQPNQEIVASLLVKGYAFSIFQDYIMTLSATAVAKLDIDPDMATKVGLCTNAIDSLWKGIDFRKILDIKNYAADIINEYAKNKALVSTPEYQKAAQLQTTLAVNIIHQEELKDKVRGGDNSVEGDLQKLEINILQNKLALAGAVDNLKEKKDLLILSNQINLLLKDVLSIENKDKTTPNQKLSAVKTVLELIKDLEMIGKRYPLEPKLADYCKPEFAERLRTLEKSITNSLESPKKKFTFSFMKPEPTSPQSTSRKLR